MRVADIMTIDVTCCSPDTPIMDVARLMCESDCGAIPVLGDDREPIGVITDRDIACRAVAEGFNIAELKARDIMSQPIVTVTPEMTLDDCCEVLEKNQLRRVVVVDELRTCRGIVAQADIARHASKDDAAEVVRAVSQSTGPTVGASL
jgi:CBS domain-containing protein